MTYPNAVPVRLAANLLGQGHCLAAFIFCLSLVTGCVPAIHPPEGPASHLQILRHIIADIDSTDHISVTGSTPTYFDYRPAGVRAQSYLANTTALQQRTDVILKMGKDTISRSQWDGCPGILMPGVSRESCPDAPIAVIAVSDTFTLTPGMGGNVDSPQLAVLVVHTYLSRNGVREAESFYSVSRSGNGWRTTRRYLAGIAN